MSNFGFTATIPSVNSRLTKIAVVVIMVAALIFVFQIAMVVLVDVLLATALVLTGNFSIF